MEKFCKGCDQVKLISEFGINKTKSDGRQSQCKECRNKYGALWYQENSAVHKKRAEASRKRSTKRNNQALWELLKDASCSDCGLVDPLVMEFDHRDEKDMNIADMRRSYSLDKIIDEIEKCDIVCANCHRRRTYDRSGCWRLDFI